MSEDKLTDFLARELRTGNRYSVWRSFLFSFQVAPSFHFPVFPDRLGFIE